MSARVSTNIALLAEGESCRRAFLQTLPSWRGQIAITCCRTNVSTYLATHLSRNISISQHIYLATYPRRVLATAPSCLTDTLIFLNFPSCEVLVEAYANE